MTRIVSIEGNIGSGKSTLVERLRDTLPAEEYHFLEEPVDAWESITDEQNVSVLARFYEDQHKYAFSFQMMAYISRLALLKDAMAAHPTKVIVTERSVMTDKHVFAKMMHDEDKIGTIDYKIYLRWFDYFLREIPETKMVYVNTSPKVCHERVRSRNRGGEQQIPLEYLETCNAYHEDWLGDASALLVVDGDTARDAEFDPVDSWCETVKLWLVV